MQVLSNTLALLLVALLYQQTCLAQVDPWDRLSKLSKKQTVKVYLRDGRQLKGTVQQVDPETLTLAPQKAALPPGTEGAAKIGNAMQLKREDVTRVTRKTRLLPMVIGAAALGGAFGIANAGSKEGTPAVRAFGTCAMAAVGAAIGAAIGHTSTIYEAERRK